jgi:uncharacterized surface protein with fasciclin (FAS1) repeats
MRPRADLEGEGVNSLYHEISALGTRGPLSTMAAAVETLGLADLLAADGYFTIFAPTDAAFLQSPSLSIDEFLGSLKNDSSAFRQHIAPGKIMTAELSQLRSIRNLINEELLIESRAGLFINDARIIEPDILRSNGVIHIIDKVLTIKQRRKIPVGRHCLPSH